jgi:hypothetical protein
MYDWETSDFRDGYNLVTRRDPREYPYGYFSLDTVNLGGIGLISWFKDIDEMADFILKIEPLIGDDEGEDLDECQRWIAPIVNDIRREGLKESSRAEINAALGASQIEWWGTFDDLCSGRSDFARDTLERYFGDDEKIPSKIPDERLDEFIEWLRTFRVF